MAEDTTKDKPEENSLESTDTSTTTSSASTEGDSLDGGPTKDDKPAVAPIKKKNNPVKGLVARLNIYFVAFMFIVVLALGMTLVAMQRSKKAEAPATITTQPLTQEAIDKLKDSEAKVGDPKQTLTIESNAIFSGKVLVRDSLDVAGGIKVGTSLSLPGLTVSGSSSFDTLQGNTLAIAGNANIQGQLNVQKGINTSGGGSFGGAITAPSISVGTIQLSGDLPVTNHIDAGGGTPGKSDGAALGGGGTASVSGTDTAGTVTINTGGSPGVGCFVTITFTKRFSGIPHVTIGPVGSAAAAVNYYINRTNTNFSICTTNSAPAGQTFSFDYIAID